MPVDGVRLLEFRKVANPKGNLTAIEGGQDVPFDIKRVFYLYDVPGGEDRGGHAHRALEQVIIAASGSFDIVVEDGVTERRFFLNRSYSGLYIPPMIWAHLENFSSGSVSLVLASAHYDESDYYRDHDEYLRVVRGRS